jgi:hypothetical protein
MPSDRSRIADDLRQQYQGVVLQQGRVILDRDFNDLQAIVGDQIAADALNEIGPYGSPDDGFLVVAKPEKPLAHTGDFALSAGTYYVGGQRAVLPDRNRLVPWSYFQQPDWINPDMPQGLGDPNSEPAFEAVYLHLFEQEVGAVEDPDLLDVALGGPDTTQRVRLMRRVERTPADAIDCATAWIAVLKLWRVRGYSFDAATMRLDPLVELQVSFTDAAAAANPCDPVAQGGYLGAENQTIRVQIAAPDANGTARLVWGYDNASFLYRVNFQGAGPNTMLLTQTPVDAYHALKPGQVVEVLRSAAIIPDGADLPGEALPRRVAEATGLITTVASYSAADNSVTVNDSLAAFTNETSPVFLRVWQGQQTFDLASAQPIVLSDPTGATAPGIQVVFSYSGELAPQPPVGSFWIFAVRPSTPQKVYPERYLAGPQPPEGPRQWLAPLATLEWARDVAVDRPNTGWRIIDLRDCRPHFDNLVELSQRTLGGCCTITVKPADAPRLQTMIDSAVGDGRPVTVCFAPGAYLLTRPLRLTKRHANLVLESCQGAATLQAHPDANPPLFLDGLIVLVEADNVKVQGLQLILRAVPLDKPLEGRLGQTTIEALDRTLANLQSMIGIRPVQSTDLTVSRCTFTFSPGRTVRTFGAGIFVAGDCSGLRVERCQFTSDTTATSTPVILKSQSLVAAAPAMRVSAPAIQTQATETVPAAPEAAKAAADPANAETLDAGLTNVPLEAIVIRAFVQIAPAPAALFGVFAFPFLGVSDSQWQSMVRDSVFRDNDFTNLALAVSLQADIGTCQVQDNRVQGCLGGIWLFPADAHNLSVLPNVPRFEELELGRLVGTVLPLPVELDPAEFRRLVALQGHPAPVYLDVAHNRIETVLDDPLQNCTVALALSVDRSPPVGLDTSSSSAVVAANEIRGRSAAEAPALAALVVIMSNVSETNNLAALTGNVIVNPGQNSISLWIFGPGGEKQTVGLAVTGNVLVGRTNLRLLRRSDGGTGPLATWAPLNSIQ